MRRGAPIALVVAPLALALGCATKPSASATVTTARVTAPVAPVMATPAPPPAPDTRAADAAAMKVALERGVTTFDVRWAPNRRFFFIAPMVAGQVRLEIYSDDGQLLSAPDVVGVPKDPAWLDDARIVYRSTQRAPSKARGKGKAARAAAAAPASEVYVIQPIRPAASPITCEGAAFTFTPAKNHIAHVVADRAGAFVAVDGQQMFPRQGRTRIVSPPSWSDDGLALAFLIVSGNQPKLVLLAEYDNPTGDVSWPLPADTGRGNLRVFWAGPGKLVVGESLTVPVFSTSYEARRATPAGGS